MSDTGRSHRRDRRAGSSRPSQHSIARQSDRPYEGTSGNNSTTSSRVSRNTGGYANDSRGNLTDSYALQNYIQRPQRDDPRTPETAEYAYRENPDNTYNNSYNSTSGNAGYSYPPANRQNNDPYTNAQRANAYNSPYNNAAVDRRYENPYASNTANGSSGPTSYANRNGGYTNGESSNARFNNNYDDYDTTSRRSSNSENNHHNTSSSRSRNSRTGSRR